MWTKKIFWGGWILQIMAGCHGKSSLPYYDTADFTPVWNVQTLKTALHTVPSFSFTNQDNHPVTEKDFDNKIYVANFFFTSCGSVCPTMTKNLLKVQKAFDGNDAIAFISHSVTPWIDSVSRLKSYALKYGLDKRWQLVTGKKETIYQLARKGYFVEQEDGFTKDSTEFLHSEHLVLVDKDRHIRGIYNGTLELEVNRLIGDIKILLGED